MNKDNIDSISEALSDVYKSLQANIALKLMDELTKYSNNPAEYQKQQLKNIKVISNIIDKEIKGYKTKLNNSIDNVVRLTLTNSIKDDEVEVEAKFKQHYENKNIELMQKQLNKDLDLLYKSNIAQYKRNVIDSYARFKSTGMDLLTSINKVANGVGVANEPKIVYKDGRKFTFKSYMEMNVRTTLSQMASDYQVEVSRSNNVVFYLCNTFCDCANDHKEYQGKMYYDSKVLPTLDKETKEKVENYIHEHKCLSLDDVMYQKPFLTTRPNCRHRFMAISTQEVLGNSVSRLIEDYRLSTGKYAQYKYKKLQEQRYNERAIRKYKEKKDNAKILLAKATTPEDKSSLQNELTVYNKKIKFWKDRNTELIEKNKFLYRDTRRENYKRVVQDVGRTYQQPTIKSND